MRPLAAAVIYNQAMVRFTCPYCEADLEVDDAFRGGVCRCYTCGTLLSVPEGRKRKQARRERPDAPAPEGGTAGSAAGAPLADAAAAAEAANSGAVGSLASASPEPSPTGKAAATRKRAERSGRRERATASPVTTVIAFVVSVATLGAVLWFAVNMLSSEAGPAVLGTEPRPAEGFDEPANPYLAGGAQFLGVSLAERTTIVIDGSEAMRDFYAHAHQAAQLAVAGAEAEQVLQVIVAREGDVVVTPVEPTAAEEVSLETVRRRLADVTPGGGLVLLQAVERALVHEPERVIVAARFLPDVEQMETIVRRTGEAEATLRVVLIGEADAEAEAVQMIREGEGAVERIPEGRLRRWYEAYRRSQRQ